MLAAHPPRYANDRSHSGDLPPAVTVVELPSGQSYGVMIAMTELHDKPLNLRFRVGSRRGNSVQVESNASMVDP